MARVALISGGTPGIGAAVSLAFLQAGYKVVPTYVADRAAAEAFRNRTGLTPYRWNVSDFEACSEGIKEVEAVVGPVDVLVNNAGIVRDAALHKMDREKWKEVIDADLGGAFNMCRVVIEGMRARKFGRIINISSINGQKGQYGQTNYSAAKAGLLGFTRALALESAHMGITVNAICPGYIDTDMLENVSDDVLSKDILPKIPVGRLGTAADIARGVLFLGSDDASFITGSTLSINGGQWMG